MTRTTPRPSRRGLWLVGMPGSVGQWRETSEARPTRRTHHATRMSAATLRVTGTHHGPVDLLGDRLARRLHRGPGGQLRLGRPDDEVHTFINDLERPIRTYLYGRRMYEVMAGWETDPTLADQSPSMKPPGLSQRLRAGVAGREGRLLDDAGAAVHRPDPDRARLRPRGGPAAESVGGADISVGGPDLAGHAITAGLVDEYHLFVTPIVVGGGTQALPDGVRIDLELVDERRFASGVVHLRYRLRA